MLGEGELYSWFDCRHAVRSKGGAQSVRCPTFGHKTHDRFVFRAQITVVPDLGQSPRIGRSKVEAIEGLMLDGYASGGGHLPPTPPTD